MWAQAQLRKKLRWIDPATCEKTLPKRTSRSSNLGPGQKDHLDRVNPSKEVIELVKGRQVRIVMNDGLGRVKKTGRIGGVEH